MGQRELFNFSVADNVHRFCSFPMPDKVQKHPSPVIVSDFLKNVNISSDYMTAEVRYA